MTNEQLIEKFNPGANLSAEDLVIMKGLTDEQISVLAKAYPNTPTRRSYIRLYDKNMKDHQQIYQLSTWQNLNNLRKYSNKKNLVAYDYKTPHSKVNVVRPVAPAKVGAKAGPVKRVIVDLSAQEAAAELTNLLKKDKSGEAKTKAEFAEKMAKAKADKKANLEKAETGKAEIKADLDFPEIQD